MGQMCVYACVCMYEVVNARPAALLSLCPSLTLLHPSGRRHPDSVNNADSNRLYRRLGPAFEETKHAGGREGYPKTEEEETDKLIPRFGEGIKELKLDRECVESRKAKVGLEIFRSWFPLQLNTLFVISLQGDLFSISCSVLLWFSVNSVSAVLH